MCSRDALMNFILRHKSKKHETSFEDNPYDDPGDFSSKYAKFVRTRVKVIMLSLLFITAFSLAVLLSLMTYSYISKSTKPEEAVIIAHRPNKLKLYTSEEQEFHIPGRNSGLDGDIAESISLGKNVEQDRPYFRSAQVDGINYESTENAVSHHNIYHDGDNDDILVENASPDEFRILDSERHVRKHKKIQEENAETRDKEFDLLELRATTVPVTLTSKNFHDPPGNPKPTKSEKKTQKTDSAEVRNINEAQQSPMTLFHVTNAIKAGAVCLDGSAPAYYHRAGSGNSANLWIIHFNGGAWCFDGKACFERSRSSLGSTKKLPLSPPIIQGINSPDPSVNPDFFDWNLVWVVYCDGASFTGNRERPLISDTGETIYLRGKRVLNAIVNDLLFNRNFKNAEAIILTGSSAGSMTAMFQADYIASKFPKTIPVRVLSDAGFFIDTAPIGGKNLGAMFKRIYELQNSSAGLNQDCVRDTGLENAWQCFLPAKTMKYIKTPMYALNSAYDIWALIYFLDIDCKFPTLEQKIRKKRNIGQRLFMKTDSELEISQKQSNVSLLSMFRRDVNGRSRRDVSGFEILPFFRDSTKPSAKETIPTPSINSKTTTGSNKAASETKGVVLDPDRLEQNNSTTQSNSTNPIRKHKNFTSFLKELGTITTDNDMDILFNEIQPDNLVKESISKNISDARETTNIIAPLKTITNIQKQNETTDVKKNVTNYDDEEHDKPTVKSVIPFSTQNSRAGDAVL